MRKMSSPVKLQKIIAEDQTNPKLGQEKVRLKSTGCKPEQVCFSVKAERPFRHVT